MTLEYNHTTMIQLNNIIHPIKDKTLALTEN